MWRVCGLIGLIVVSVWSANNTLYLTFWIRVALNATNSFLFNQYGFIIINLYQ